VKPAAQFNPKPRKSFAIRHAQIQAEEAEIEAQRYRYEERAAIHEFDGKATRADAERMGRKEVYGKD